MKTAGIVALWSFVALCALGDSPARAGVNEVELPVVVAEDANVTEAENDATALGSRDNGESCVKDCQCASLECKGFKCVKRDLAEHPLLPKGKACAFDGDCASCDCKRGTCS